MTTSDEDLSRRQQRDDGALAASAQKERAAAEQADHRMRQELDLERQMRLVFEKKARLAAAERERADSEAVDQVSALHEQARLEAHAVACRAADEKHRLELLPVATAQLAGAPRVLLIVS